MLADETSTKRIRVEREFPVWGGCSYDVCVCSWKQIVSIGLRQLVRDAAGWCITFCRAQAKLSQPRLLCCMLWRMIGIFTSHHCIS